MNNRLFYVLAVAAIATSASSCKMLSGKKKSGLPNDGQLHGVAPGVRWNLTKPPGMVYVPPGTFHMGPSDEDVNYAYTARNKQVSISGFWMDATEITNNEYRQFTNWVRDSIAAKLMGYVKQGQDGNEYIDWKKASTIKWGDKATIEKIDAIIVTPDNRIFGKKELDAKKIVYQSEIFDYKAAAQNKDVTVPRSAFIVKQQIPVYPDSLCWVRDFAYSYNEPMAKKYYSHPAYGNYPVVGVSWKQATAFCEWRTHYLNAWLEGKKRTAESDFRLPTEAQWEYAARGGRSQMSYPWGGPYLRNKKGCLLANFKPGRGNYPEDGGLYTVRADAYWPNDFGLYNMAGNVAEWTSSLYYEGSYNFQHDLNPDVRFNAKDSDPPRMKRKVLRGGSWKDVGYFLQTSTRAYEYQDTSKSYIGFRCVIDLPPAPNKRGR
ncbi:SUMF1/EgtB/PvdO family nonheme iron enzyme [Ferruginibacter sp. HRS2-29]|uniref:type IX secretion system lipoprotein PorK/GldK n=1 Tax=Ferruginibacter sp. HRS2-29 TaxID=2487334 RepID=UPI0020CD0ABB|nr:SUMF1/EgtB/PvdO family nonheme iron enzyme [Ferruginibacter sp. HRS2-29]MCP9751726.1 gliding motility-associated lipoprotein [Ferruginibacter sp. HRS2-29]